MSNYELLSNAPTSFQLEYDASATAKKKIILDWSEYFELKGAAKRLCPITSCSIESPEAGDNVELKTSSDTECPASLN